MSASSINVFAQSVRLANALTVAAGGTAFRSGQASFPFALLSNEQRLLAVVRSVWRKKKSPAGMTGDFYIWCTKNNLSLAILGLFSV